MRLWDQRDITIIHQVFKAVAPDSIAQRADMLIEVARRDMITVAELERAIDRRVMRLMED